MFELQLATRLLIHIQPALRSDGKVLGNPSRWSFQSMHQRSRWGEGTQGTQGTEIFAGFFANCASFERRNEFWSWRSEVQTPVANGWSIFSHQRNPCASLNVLLTVRHPIHGLFMKTVSPWLWGQSLLHWRTWHLGLNMVGMRMDQIPYITFW